MNGVECGRGGTWTENMNGKHEQGGTWTGWNMDGMEQGRGT